MAKKAKPPVTAIDQVRMPLAYLDALDDLVEVLHERIVKKAFEMALARVTGSSLVRVNAHDLRASAQSVMPSALAELDTILKPREIRHVRKKAS